MSHDAENHALLEELAALPVDEKNFIPDENRTLIFRKLRARQENRVCFDCPARNPTWISLSHGCYVCLECSGEHRRFGVHISFVRSVELDSFTKDQLAMMITGGNGKARQYFKQVGIDGKRKEKGSGGQRCVDYYDKSALKYRKQLEKDTVTACKAVNLEIAAAARDSINSDGGNTAGNPVNPFNTVTAASPVPATVDKRSSPKDSPTDDGGNNSSASKPSTVVVGKDNPFAGGNNPFAAKVDLKPESRNSSPFAGQSNNLDPFGFGATTVQPMKSNNDSSDPFGFGSGAARSNGPSGGKNSSPQDDAVGHFATSSNKRNVVNKAAVLDDDFDFDAFEDEANKKVVIPPPVVASAVNGGQSNGNYSGFGAPATRQVEGTYGLPLNETPAVFGFGGSSAGSMGQDTGQESMGRGNSGFNSGNPFEDAVGSSFKKPISTQDTNHANVANKKSFGSDDYFGSKQGGREVAASTLSSFANKQSFGSDDVFGQGGNHNSGRSVGNLEGKVSELLNSKQADDLKNATKVAMEKSQRAAQEGFAQAKEAWRNWTMRS